MSPNPIERRKQIRLPFAQKIIFSDGKTVTTAHAGNISRGGLFVKTLTPLNLETKATVVFFLPSQKQTICTMAKVAHVAFDRYGENDSGMGFIFTSLNETQKQYINAHIVHEQRTYTELKKLLAMPTPDVGEITNRLKQLRHVEELDLMELRYRVQRICQLFEIWRTTEGDEQQAS